MASELVVEWLGRVPYTEALELQQKRVEARRSGAAGDVLFLLEHPPVVTLGPRARPENLRASREWLAARGVEVHDVSRGGDVTYHGPGQLVGYLVVDLSARGTPDVLAFLRRMEAALIEALGELGVDAVVRPGYTGVFAASGARSEAQPSEEPRMPRSGARSEAEPSGVQRAAEAPARRPRKIASIGVGVRRWVTYHGFALNVEKDLSGFEWIVPCGLADVDMTSVARELGPEAPADLAARTREAVAGAFRRRFAPPAEETS